jgi:ATP-binding cassette, subfamily B, bacterial CvaB/MchF/RaxB
MIEGVQLGFRRRQRIRPVRQTEVAECGLACLAMVAGFHGLDCDLGSLRRQFPTSMSGATLKSLIALADRMKLTARPLKVALEDLPHLQFPAILHWDLHHFVVIEGFRKGKAIIHNPAGLTSLIPVAELSRHYTGVALELAPAADFEPAEQRHQLRLGQLWNRVTGLKRSLAQTLVLSLVLQAYVLVAPYYMQIAIDSALPALDLNLLAVLALGFGLLLLVNVGASLLRSFVILSGGTQLGFGLSVNIARRLFRLPVAWFERRHVGDVLSRFQSIGPIQETLTAGPVAALLDGSLAVLTLALMFFYSVTLGSIVLVAFLLYAAVRAIAFPLQRAAQEEVIHTAAKSQTLMIESIRGITTLRLSNREATRLAIWQNAFSSATNASVGMSRIRIWQEVANILIFGLETILVVWLAISMVIAGGFSVGMVFAFLAYKMQFQTKVVALIDQTVAFRMLKLHLERLSDIALASEDASFGPSAGFATPLAGRIELRNVTYRYSDEDPFVLKGIDLLVQPGEHVAITGPSGGGKTTLGKILLGLVEPVSGEMLVDGQPLGRFGYRSYHEQVAAVLQDDNLFAGSLAENIALFDESPDPERIGACARAAAIHDDIIAMPMGYETLVGDMGSTLSGGQKQRILLARALYRQPRLLIMDEGTSHLDRAHEERVNLAIAAMGITRIIIAHRQETLDAADRIVTLVGGRIDEPERAPSPVS